MPTTDLARLPYPSGGAAPYAAADLMALAKSLDPLVLLRATDEADRDAKYLGAAAGSIVVGTARDAVWQRTASGWRVLHQGKTSFTSTARIFRTDTGATIPSSTAVAFYTVVNDVVTAHYEATVNADTVGPCGIALPVTSAERLIGIGVAGIFGSDTPADQTGMAYMLSTSSLVITGWTQGYRPAKEGNIVRYQVSYPKA